MASLLSEKEKFDEIEKIYHGGNIPQILADQSIKVNQLSTKRQQLQMTLIGKFIRRDCRIHPRVN